MGRAPCCDKANVKRGPWSPEEDAILKGHIESHGTGGNWITLPQKAGLKRCGKSCRLRWLNYLRPDIKLGGFTEEEDNVICSLYFSIGSRWSVIASNLPGRTDNDVKNHWNTRLKKKLLARRIPTGDTDMANVNPNPSTSGKIGISGNRLSSSFPKPSTSTLPHLPHPSSSQPKFFSPVSSLPSLTEVSDNTGSVASANMDFQVSSSQEFSSSIGSSSSITEESYSKLSIDNLLDLDFGVMYDILSSGFGFEQVTGNRTSVVSTLKVSDA